MSNAAIILIGMCKKFLALEIEIEAFVQCYQEYFEDHQKQLIAGEFDKLDEIYMTCEYFQPDEGIRSADWHYLSESQVRETIARKVKEFEAISV